MAEKLIAGLVCAIVALPVIYLGLRFRAGRSLEAIAGYNPERVRDKAGFGRFVGAHVALLGLLTLALGAVIAFVPDHVALWAVLGFVAAMQVPVLRLVLGIPKFHQR
jgi:hypothetical protein